MTEQEHIKEAFEELLKSLRKDTSKESRQRIKEAFEFANEAHKGVRRRSGEPYIIHPVEVAKILAGLEVDTHTVIAAFLHDILEDTDTKPETVEELFGTDVLNLVQGVTKLGKLQLCGKERGKRTYRRYRS